MENEVNISNDVKTWIIIGVVALITFVLAFIISYWLLNDNKKEKTKVTEDTESVFFYDAYSIGDEVELVDGSKWHVLYNSIENTEFVTLLSDFDVNTKGVLYSNLNSYLENTYKNKLLTGLKAKERDIEELRLFAYLDLAVLTGMETKEFAPEPGDNIELLGIPEFIYSKQTVTDTVYNVNSESIPVMICPANVSSNYSFDKINSSSDESNKGEAQEELSTTQDNDGKDVSFARICLGNPKEGLPARVVLIISKSYIESGEK